MGEPTNETKYFNTLEVWRMNYQDETIATKPEPTQVENKVVVDDILPF